MPEARSTRATRHKVAVSIDRDGGAAEELAYMFIAPMDRVTDVLNDDRDFLPFERPDGSVFVVAKRTIRCLTPLDVGQRINESNPYELLGVTLAATDDEVRTAYQCSIAAVDPDRVHALGLPRDFLELATRKAALLSAAYRKIKALRKAETVNVYQ